MRLAPTILTHTSPNYNARKNVNQPNMIVLHYTAMVHTTAAIARLCNPQYKVSAHYLIDESGQIISMVDERHRAWHAGVSGWGRVRDVNSHSIGIELANASILRDFPPFTLAQMDSLVGLLRDIMRRYNILPQRVLGHSDVALGRKIDPGVKFDWRWLADCGVSIWPMNIMEAAVDWDEFCRHARIFGYYFSDNNDRICQAILTAFRLRFLPAMLHNKFLSPRDMGTMAALGHDFPAINP